MPAASAHELEMLISVNGAYNFGAGASTDERGKMP
jgi:hypothetical protein